MQNEYVIKTRSKKYGDHEFIVDKDIYLKYGHLSWYAMNNNGLIYARCKIDGRNKLLHRLVIGVNDPAIEVDHIDRNTKNNRIQNLRLATRRQNMLNVSPRVSSTSKYKGVCYLKNLKKWQSSIVNDGRTIFIGLFDDEVQAARSYDQVLRAIVSKDDIGYAYLNFPDSIFDIVDVNYVLNKKLHKTSKYVGVIFNKKYEKFQARIFVNRVCNNLGYFDSEAEAALAYNNYIDLHNIRRKKNVIYDNSRSGT